MKKFQSYFDKLTEQQDIRVGKEKCSKVRQSDYGFKLDVWVKSEKKSTKEKKSRREMQ